MFSLNNIRNKYIFLRNSPAIPFFYEKLFVIPRSFNNAIHFMTLGRIANGVFHDLMNPITSLLISIELKNSHNISDLSESGKELSEFLKVIQNQLKNNPQRESFLISKTINDTAILIKYKAMMNNVRIVIVNKDECELFGNRLVLMRAVLNLINNAIESYERCPREMQDVVISFYKEKEYLNIRISDFGCGISKKDQKKIFNYFYTNKSDGTGIGLPISYRSIKKEYRGEIMIESEDGKGSNFIIKIPLKTSV